MAYSPRSGRKVSEYRKQAFNFTQATSGGSSTVVSNIFAPLVHNANRVTQLKHLRGFVTLAPQYQTYTKYAHGYICLIRYPSTESISDQDVNIEASYLLHPVPFAVMMYPQTIPYEFEAVTLGPLEKLVMVVHNQSNQNLFCDFSFLWDQRLEITD